MSPKAKSGGKVAKKGEVPEALTFEAALERLEALVERLEEGKISLDESLAAYVEGTRLVRHCQERLNHAETVIRELAETSEGLELRASSLEDTLLGDDEDDADDDDGDEDREETDRN
jgi:exodeoxyribonuclease VII small subunit